MDKIYVYYEGTWYEPVPEELEGVCQGCELEKETDMTCPLGSFCNVKRVIFKETDMPISTEVVGKKDVLEPFTLKNKNMLRNKWIVNKNSSQEYLIVGITDKGVFLGCGTHLTYEQLFEDYSFLNGSCCGVKV